MSQLVWWPPRDVEHVVGHVGAGNVVGDHLHAEGAAGAGSLVDLGAGDERGGGGRVGGHGCAFGAVHQDGLVGAGDVERDVQDGIGARRDGDGLGECGEAGGRRLPGGTRRAALRAGRIRRCCRYRSGGRTAELIGFQQDVGVRQRAGVADRAPRRGRWRRPSRAQREMRQQGMQ